METERGQPGEGRLEEATLGAGCFWCVEAVFQRIRGVEHVESGYSGGALQNPTYEQVCTGRTGHAEVARIVFDPNVLSFEQILEVFWHSHDPTTLNRQGADVGTQYRSVIFYHDEGQRLTAEKSKERVEASKLWPDPIVTLIEPIRNYYKAEDYHQNYFKLHSTAPYCSFVIGPKLAKFQREFAQLLKRDPTLLTE